MDTLTHTAIGLFLSRAGLNRWTPRAAPILILAANAPDIDILSAAGGSLGYLHYHRHLTHSLIAMPVMALLPVLLVRMATRKPIHWAGAYCAALIAVASHLLLDWTNVYGIRLALPFSGQWFRGDLTSVVDLWIWGLCLLGVAGPFLSRLVGSEIASGRRPMGATGSGSRSLRCWPCSCTMAAGRRSTRAPWRNWKRVSTTNPFRCGWPRCPQPPIPSGGGDWWKPASSTPWPR